ncbi:MAG TPA: LCP family protein [Anaerolineales bacterium]|nr:LCP family protein [Anaerolineales bacterium]
MSSSRRTTLRMLAAIIGGGVVVVIAAGVLTLSQRINKPLGPGLGLPTQTAAPSPTHPAAPLAAAPVTETATPAPLCGGPPSMIVLGIGADNRENNYLYGLADAIRVARIDFTVPSVSVLTFPRDLWVEIPDIAGHYGIDHGKINQAYLYGNPGMGYYDGPGAGPGLLARTLDLNFGLRPDHYGAVNMRTFVRLVDAVGGIDLYLDQPVDGRPIDNKTEDMGYFTAGAHHMDGATALRFSRIRKVDSAFRRDDRQTQVLCALKEKLVSPDVVTDIPQIIAAFQGSVLTDLSPAQLASLACLGPMLRPENLRFASLPEDLLTAGRNAEGSFVLQPDMPKVRELVQGFLAGTWPTEPDQPSCP